MKRTLFTLFFIYNVLLLPVIATATTANDTSAPASEEKGSFWHFIPEGEWAGFGFIGGRYVEGAGESARFNEYRDIISWVYGDVRGFFNKEDYNTTITAKNIGLDDQLYSINGGRYQNYKYSIYYDETPHNYSYHNRTIYTSGIGTATLSYAYPDNAGGANFTPSVTTNSDLWNPFRYTSSQKILGGSYDIFLGNPVSVYIGANQVWREGLRPQGASSGVKTSQTATASPQGHSIEFPEPMDFSTTNVFSLFDYKADNLYTSFDIYYSNFTNNIPYITWRNPFVTTQILNETSTIAPNNNYFKLTFKGTVRDIPLFNTNFVYKGSYAFLINDIPILDTIADYTPHSNVGMPTYLTTTLLLDRPNFVGDIAYWNASGIFSSNPLTNLDTKVWVIGIIKSNDSTPITFTDAGQRFTTESVFHYAKMNTGIEAGYNLPAKTRLTGGYDLHWINRVRRPDVQATTENSADVGLRNSYLDFLTAKLGYSYAIRNSTITTSPSSNGTTPTGNNGWINRFFRKFDVSDRRQQIAKASIELYPIDNLDTGIEFSYTNNRYSNLTLGRLRDRTYEWYIDATYTIPHHAVITGYFSLEDLEINALRRRFGSTNSADPSTPPTTAAYNWGSEIDDDGYAYGMILEMPIIEDKLDFVGSWEFERSKGSIFFSPQNNVVTLIDVIDRYDSYRKRLLQVKGIYRWSKHISATLGYTYEKFTLYDYLLQNYQFFGMPSAGSQWFLTGAYNDYDYDVNIVFAELACNF